MNNLKKSDNLLKLLFLAAVLTLPASAVQVTLTSGDVATANVGAVNVGARIRLSATSDVQGAVFRFRMRPVGGVYRTVRDYSPNGLFDLSAGEQDGLFDVEVTAMSDTGEVSAATTQIEFASRRFGNRVTASPTSHPLVQVLSAPPCAVGQKMRVEYYTPGSALQSTSSKDCTGGNMNFYVAGLKSIAGYGVHTVIEGNGTKTVGDDTYFVTGALPAGLFTDIPLVQSPNANAPLLLGASLAGAVAFASDGTPLWYADQPDLAYITRAEAGTFWGIVMGPGTVWDQKIRKFDLAGNTILETNAGRVNQQLQAMGKRPISSFHHEVRTLPGGRIAALAAVEQTVTDLQGPGNVNVLGDMIVVLDENLNVVWTWDTFDNLDVRRKAVLNEKCGGIGGACPVYFQSVQANDWTHGNSIAFTADGNLVYSARHQDWLIKISYDNGNGDGHIVWRLGKDGDFAAPAGSIDPWFSHQHDGNFDPTDPTRLLVFDNGNTRVAKNGPSFSRGLALHLDEKNMTVSFDLNVYLGVFSAAVGTAQKLDNGNYHFDAGFVMQPDKSIQSYSFEVNPSGVIVGFAKQTGILYRSFRLNSLYSSGN